jgi:hypothetical protein
VTDQVDRAKAAAKPTRLPARDEVPRPLRARLRIVARDRLRCERQARDLLGQASVVLQVRLSFEFLRRRSERRGRRVVAEAGADLELHAVEEEPLAVLPDRRRQVALDQRHALAVDHLARLQLERRCVLPQRPSAELRRGGTASLRGKLPRGRLGATSRCRSEQRRHQPVRESAHRDSPVPTPMSGVPRLRQR